MSRERPGTTTDWMKLVSHTIIKLLSNLPMQCMAIWMLPYFIKAVQVG
jgi:hypothetical protein